ncbi:MAG: DUF1844 domain-containing protein [Deltaproteobacteria bacterium]
MEEEKKSFVVKDRRGFSEEKPVEQEKQNTTKQEAEGNASFVDEQTPSEEQKLPEMNFTNFIISMSTTAMFHFGMFPDPETKQANKNLPAAKQVIDILGMLQEKTKGNLTKEEETMFEESIYSLRMYFLKIKEESK